MKLYSSWVPPNRDCGIFRDLGMGIVFTPRANRTPLDGIPWILDNGAFGAWIRKTKFDGYRFLRSMRLIPKNRLPDFIVIPDIVAGGKKSLDFSLRWIGRMPFKIPKYLAVQDGMGANDIWPLLESIQDGIDGLFVGGTMKWKLYTAKFWIELAHEYRRSAHIGRCGPLERIQWAQKIKADSVDSGSWARNGDWRRNLTAAARTLERREGGAAERAKIPLPLARDVARGFL